MTILALPVTRPTFTETDMRIKRELDPGVLGQKRAEFGEATRRGDAWSRSAMIEGYDTDVLFPAGSATYRFDVNVYYEGTPKRPRQVGWISLESKHGSHIDCEWELPIWWSPAGVHSLKDLGHIGTLEAMLRRQGLQVRAHLNRSERAWLALGTGFASYYTSAGSWEPAYAYFSPDGKVQERKDVNTFGKSSWFSGPFPITDHERLELARWRRTGERNSGR